MIRAASPLTRFSFSHWLFLLFGLAALLLLARSAMNAAVFATSFQGLAIAFAVPAVALAGSIVMVRASPETRNRGALLIISTLVPLYAIESWLVYSRQQPAYHDVAIAFAEQNSESFDTRSILEVTTDLRARGIEAYPGGSPSGFPIVLPNGEAVVPPPGIGNTVTVGCNEGGKWEVWKTDEFGFKNPPGIWGRDEITLMAVGDSFTAGVCVPMNQDIVGTIRQVHPNSLNLGVSGTNPVYYYQLLLEYGSVAKPRNVVFIWFEGNDVSGLLSDVSDPILSRYLTRTVPVGIHRYQSMIDEENVRRRDRALASPWEERMRETALLYNVRKLLGLSAAASGRPELFDMIKAWRGKATNPHDAAVFDRESFVTLMKTANTVVKSWGGRLIFVYLPDWNRYCHRVETWAGYCGPTPTYSREAVIEAIGGLDIPLIDMSAIFEAHPNPGTLYRYPGSHNSAAGYRLIGQTILEKLAAP